MSVKIKIYAFGYVIDKKATLCATIDITMPNGDINREEVLLDVDAENRVIADSMAMIAAMKSIRSDYRKAAEVILMTPNKVAANSVAMKDGKWRIKAKRNVVLVNKMRDVFSTYTNIHVVCKRVCKEFAKCAKIAKKHFYDKYPEKKRDMEWVESRC